MSTAPPLPPKPVADRDTQPYWDAVAEHRLIVQRCDSCDAWVWQPRPLCPRCHGESLTWTDVSGAATVVSWTALHPPVLAVWADKLPFVILLVELDDAPGVRMIGQLTDDAGELLRSNGEPEGIAIGARLGLRWRIDEAGQTLPAWTLA
ncbi:MAG TPA: zinc ribbon domain-containing protein [Actinomycetota bacterium]|nr:zinc ribbon domain-containing protein [Actinomycetota bacterium]